MMPNAAYSRVFNSFGEALISTFILLFFTFITIFTLSLRRNRKDNVSIIGERTADKIVISLSVLVLVLGFFLTSSVERPAIYFLLQGVLAGLVLITMLTNRLARPVLLFYTITAIGSIPLMISFHNNFYPIYNVADTPLFRENRIDTYMRYSAIYGFYYFIPVDELINVQTSYVTGTDWPPIVFIMRNTLYLLIIILISYVLGRNSRLRFLSLIPLILATIPSMSFQDRIISIPYAMAIIYVLLGMGFDTAAKLLLTLLITVMVFAHPVGSYALIPVLLMLFILLYIYKLKNNFYIKTKNVLIMVSLVTASYWFTTYIYTLMINKAGKLTDSLVEFFRSLIGGPGGAQYIAGTTISYQTAPGYSKPDFYIYAINWSMVIAVSSAFLITLLLIKKLKINNMKYILFTAFAIPGLTYIALSYIGYSTNVETGQYMIPTGYFLLAISSSIALGEVSRAKKIIILVSIVIGLSVMLGVNTPNWAPLEHQNFEVIANMHPYYSYIEAEMINKLVPEYSLSMAWDYDIPLHGGQYKSIRAIIHNIALGDYPDDTIVALRTDRVYGLDRVGLFEASAVTYNSDYHIILAFISSR